MMGLFSGAGCNSDGMVDFDLLTITELDPTWNNEVLASFSFPETAAVANPLGVASCAVDAAAANAGAPLNDMFWCSGVRSDLSDFRSGDRAAGQSTSLKPADHAPYATAPRGFARRTYGNDAMCQSQIDTFLPKEQYRLTQFAPRPRPLVAESLAKVRSSGGALKNIQVGPAL